MSKFQNHYNRKDYPDKGEVNTMLSLTIPDQSFTIEEIYRRFAQGRPVNIENTPVYDGDVYLPEWKKLDLAEREQLLKDVAGRVNMLRKDYQTLKTQHDAKQAEKKRKFDSNTSKAEKPSEDTVQSNSTTTD